MIAATPSRIKVITDNSIRQMHPADAIMLVQRYPDCWKWRLRKTGIKWIRMIASIPARPWESCYRTAEAPVLPPSMEWLRSVGYRASL